MTIWPLVERRKLSMEAGSVRQGKPSLAGPVVPLKHVQRVRAAGHVQVDLAEATNISVCTLRVLRVARGVRPVVGIEPLVEGVISGVGALRWEVGLLHSRFVGCEAQRTIVSVG
jgi:hypothetical protein